MRRILTATIIYHILSFVIIACNGQATTTPEPFTDEADPYFLVVIVVIFIVIPVCCICLCILCCCYVCCQCCKGCIKSIFKCLLSPFIFIRWILGKIFFCRGCDIEVGSRFCSSFFNGVATAFMILRTGIIVSTEEGSIYSDYQHDVADGINSVIPIVIDVEYIQASIIIIFVLICFFIKLFKLCRAYKKAKEDASENIEAVKVKNLQTVIITSSDTIFKILTAIAIVIGSSYSGTEKSSSATQYIYVASSLGFLEEILDMLDQYLTMCIFFEKKEVFEDKIGVELNVNIQDNIEDKMEEKVESTQSTQKTILWQALWATIKLLILLSEQCLALIAAIALIIGDNNEKLLFIIIVIGCCCLMIIISFCMCIKFQKLSCGLCCKYYFCCFYNCCSDYCDKSWIKIDPIENKNATLNQFGQVIIIKQLDTQGKHTNTTNPPLTIQQGQQGPHQTNIEMFQPSIAESVHSVYSRHSVVNAPQSYGVNAPHNVVVLSHSNPMQQ